MKEKIITSFKRVCKLGWRNFSREKGLSFVAVFVLFVTISLITLLFLLRGISEIVIENIEDKADITVDFELAVSEEEIFSIKEKLSEEFEVNGIQYVSREEARADFIERYGDRPAVMDALEDVGNPFPASLNIKAEDTSVYGEVAGFLEDSHPELIYNIDYYNRKDVIDGIFSLTESIRRSVLTASIVLGIVTILLVYNTTKLAIYGLKDEVRVMRLVGSSNLFIQGSFIIQGALIGVFAAFVSFLLFLLVGFLIPQTLSIMLELDFRQYLLQNIPLVLLIQFAVGIILGMISSLIAVSRYLKV